MEQKKPTIMDKLSFYNGFMLALGSIQNEFLAEGPTFHQAFYNTIKYAQEEESQIQIKGASWFQLDPIFGIVREAHEMLLEAEENRLIALLNPEFRKAQFRIGTEEAEEELQDTVAPDWFLKLANYFNEQLQQAR